MLGIFLVCMGVGLILGVALFSDRKAFKVRNRPCLNGHSWEELPDPMQEGFVYLRCKDCNKTLGEVLGD